MEQETKKILLKELYNELDNQCEQYKFANNITHDKNELNRITKNIQALQRTIEIFK